RRDMRGEDGAKRLEEGFVLGREGLRQRVVLEIQGADHAAGELERHDQRGPDTLGDDRSLAREALVRARLVHTQALPGRKTRLEHGSRKRILGRRKLETVEIASRDDVNLLDGTATQDQVASSRAGGTEQIVEDGATEVEGGEIGGEPFEESEREASHPGL